MTSRTALGWLLSLLLSAAGWAQPNVVAPGLPPVKTVAPAEAAPPAEVKAPGQGPSEAPSVLEPGEAQTEMAQPPGEMALTAYLAGVEPMLARRAELEAGFRKAVLPLRRRQELGEIRALVQDLDLAWDDLRLQVAFSEVPAEAALHHQSLLRIVEIEQADNALLLETIDEALALTTELRVLKEAGAGEEARRARITGLTSRKESLAARLRTFQVESAALEATLEAEQVRLAALAP